MINQFETVEDFIADESFQNFVLKQNDADVARWQAYIHLHPDQSKLISEAESFINLLSPKHAMFEKPIQSKNKKYFYLIGLVSCILVLLSVWFFGLSANAKEQSLVTKFADSENLNIIFPDQTELELRKGSSIQYYQDWNTSSQRKIWLKGEAFFSVEKSKKGNQIFEVHLDHGLIRVLGTKFLVRSEQEDISVILEEGKVECLVNDQTIMMKPGDVLSSSKGIVSLEQSQKVRSYDSWRSGKLSFKNVSIEEVIHTINNSYPLKVTLGNQALKNRKITATVDQNDPLLLLHALAAIYNIELIEKENKVILK